MCHTNCTLAILCGPASYPEKSPIASPGLLACIFSFASRLSGCSSGLNPMLCKIWQLESRPAGAPSKAQESCTQARSTRGEKCAGTPPLDDATRTSNPSVHAARAPPPASRLNPVVRRKKRPFVSRTISRVTVRPGSRVNPPRSRAIPPIGSAATSAGTGLTTASLRPVSAASSACSANITFCPLCCSNRPAKKLPDTSAPMMTRAKSASASANPRSSARPDAMRIVTAASHSAESPVLVTPPRGVLRLR
jgi:hypothetical protein